MDVTTRNRQDLKSYFVKNAIPTESNFSELIDGMLNQNDDGVVKLPGSPLSIQAPGDDDGPKKALNLYRNFTDANPDWSLSLNPRSDPNNAATARVGLGITDGEGNTRLFIDRDTGNVGLGTNDPQGKLDVRGAVHAGNSELYFTNASHNFTAYGDTNGYAAIENAANYGALMILGRAGTAKGRYVRLWDYLQVNGGLDVTGNVGIGTANPGHRLDVSGAVRATGGVYIGGNLNAHLNGDGVLYRYGGQAYITVDDNLYIRDSGSGVKFHFDTDNGSLGIGGTGPGTSKLKIISSATDYVDTIFAAAGSGQLQFAGWSQGWNINAKTDGKHLFINRDAGADSNVLIGRSGKELFVRGSDGKVGIGTAAPGATFNVAGSEGAGRGIQVDNREIKFRGDGDSHYSIYGNRLAGNLTIENTSASSGMGTAGTVLMTLGKSGNIGIGVTAPQAKLHIEGGVDASLSAHGFLVLGAVDGENMVIDNNEIMVRKNGATSPLHLQWDGGQTRLGGKLQVNGANKIFFTDTDTSNNLKLQLWTGYGLGINSATLFYAANGNHSWRDSAGANERMKLTTAADGGLYVYGTGTSRFAGYVKTKTVYFSAYVESNSREDDLNPLLMKKTSQNVGSGWSTSTSKFTAPVAGIYLFTMTGYKADGGDGGLSWYLRVNNGYANSMGSGETSERCIMTMYKESTTNARTLVVKLDKDDLVYIEQKGTGRVDNYRSGLEGVLLVAT